MNEKARHTARCAPPTVYGGEGFFRGDLEAKAEEQGRSLEEGSSALARLFTVWQCVRSMRTRKRIYSDFLYKGSSENIRYSAVFFFDSKYIQHWRFTGCGTGTFTEVNRIFKMPLCTVCVRRQNYCV